MKSRRGQLQTILSVVRESKRLKTAVMVVELRDDHGMSQQALADKVGAAKSTIVRIENAEVNTSIAMLDRIANAVDRKLQ